MGGNELRAHAGSYVDPAGTVYESGDGILRAIRPPFSAFVTDVLNRPSVKAMVGRQIVETCIEDCAPLPGYGLTLWHKRIAPVSYCSEWPVAMLREAALLTLYIADHVTVDGLALQDASPWNVLFEGPRPVFVDFTSITTQDPNLPWIAYDQFCRFFLYPLALSRYVPDRARRPMLSDSVHGISVEEFVRLLPARAVARMPWLVARVYLPWLLLRAVRRTGTDRLVGDASRRLRPTARARRAFFAGLARIVRRVPLPENDSAWSRYYDDVESFFHPARFNKKQRAVARILEQLQPKAVVDIGCNRGGYSVLAALAGGSVTAFDTDEASVGCLYRLAREKGLNILPLVMDVLNPSPACGWRTVEFASAPQRFRSDLAMALALVHHLAITQHQSFERIVPALSDYAEQWLLTEFVPLSDPRAVDLMATLRRDMAWYTLENFTAALRRAFSSVETAASYPEGRVLILCRR